MKHGSPEIRELETLMQDGWRVDYVKRVGSFRFRLWSGLLGVSTQECESLDRAIEEALELEREHRAR